MRAGSQALMYARRHDNSWSRPVDVLVSPSGARISYPALALDQQGYLHVVWQEANNQIYYSRAHVSMAGTARGWSVPKPLADRDGFRLAIAASSDGLLHFVYAAKANFFYRQSADLGRTWTAQTTITTLNSQFIVDYPSVAADANGHIHTVWTQAKLPEVYPPTGLFYSRSDDGGKTWLSPLQIAAEKYGQPSVIVKGADIVYLAWNGIVSVGDRMYSWSKDGGRTWTPAERISQKISGGFTGSPSLAFDSLGALHLVTSVTGKNGKTEDVYHLTYTQAGWSQPVFISPGATGRQAVDSPALAISNGNQLHVVYEDDHQRIWYTSRIVDVPALPKQVIPTPLSVPTTAPKQTVMTPPVKASIAPTRNAVDQVEPTDVGIKAADPIMPLLIGIVPVLVIILVIVAQRLFQQ